MGEGFIRSTLKQSYRNQLWLIAGGVAVTTVVTFLVASDAGLKTNRTLVLVVGCLVAFALLWKIPDILARMRHMPPSHPIAIELSRFGEPEAIADEVDRELQQGRERIGRIGITENWLVYPNLGALSLVRLDEIVWVYKQVIHRRGQPRGSPFSDKWALIIWDEQVVGLTITDYEEIANEILLTLTERVPWAIYGYTEERKAIWKTTPDEMIEAVAKRREAALAPTPSQPAENSAKM